MVLVGHNGEITWGITLAFTDADDLYIEKLDESDHSKYIYKNKSYDFEIFKERINVKGEIPHEEKVRITRHGPIISDIVEMGNYELIAVQSMGLRPSKVTDGFLKLNSANKLG